MNESEKVEELFGRISASRRAEFNVTSHPRVVCDVVACLVVVFSFWRAIVRRQRDTQYTCMFAVYSNSLDSEQLQVRPPIQLRTLAYAQRIRSAKCTRHCCNVWLICMHAHERVRNAMCKSLVCVRRADAHAHAIVASSPDVFCALRLTVQYCCACVCTPTRHPHSRVLLVDSTADTARRHSARLISSRPLKLTAPSAPHLPPAWPTSSR
jgi:hypothetical protein